MSTTTRLAQSLLLLVSVLGLRATAQNAMTGFAEEFAVSDDRAALLEKLIPGTEAWYYYRCLERQHSGALDEVPPILDAWIDEPRS